MKLSELGERICILGPSGSGKSTLAYAIAQERQLQLVHLDQLHHLPHSNWEARPEAEFFELHDAAIAADRWVIDGNYSKCMPRRFRRATGVILLDSSTSASLFRYVRRTLLERDRYGALEGRQDSIKWQMIHHIVVVTPKNRQRYAAIYRELELPKLFLPSLPAIDRCYREWGLERHIQGG
jgi:adenylate kinase family enzyme